MSVIILATAGGAAIAQSEEPTPVLDAMEQGIRSDPRVALLKATDPENLVSEAVYSMEWPRVRERDIYWKSRIMRSIDFRDDYNKQLITSINGKIDLFQLLAAGATQGRFAAFGASDERLTKQISSDSVQKLLTYAVQADNRNERIMKFRIKQDWLYLGPEKKLVSRIISIAPLRESVVADGVIITEPLFWIYYPSIRSWLRQQHIPGKDGSGPNLDEVFENWNFRSPIISATQKDQMNTLDFLSRANRERMLGKD